MQLTISEHEADILIKLLDDYRATHFITNKNLLAVKKLLKDLELYSYKYKIDRILGYKNEHVNFG